MKYAIFNFIQLILRGGHVALLIVVVMSYRANQRWLFVAVEGELKGCMHSINDRQCAIISFYMLYPVGFFAQTFTMTRGRLVDLQLISLPSEETQASPTS